MVSRKPGHPFGRNGAAISVQRLTKCVDPAAPLRRLLDYVTDPLVTLLVALGVLPYLTGGSRATVMRGEAEAEMSFMLPRAFMLPCWVIVTQLVWRMDKHA